MRADHAVDRVGETQAQLFAQMIAQRRALIRHVLDRAVVAGERQIAAAPLVRPKRWPAVGWTAGVVILGVNAIQWSRGLRRQAVGARRLRGIGRTIRARDDLIKRRPLPDRSFRGLVALQQRIALKFALDERGRLDIGILQQLDRLTQLRRHDQCLALSKI
jgi:hypothetical protein